MRRSLPIPPLAELEKRLTLDPVSGELRWRGYFGNTRAGDLAGSPKEDGKVIVSFDGVLLPAHRLVWAMFHREDPPPFIRHRDGDLGNNAPSNLAAAASARTRATAAPRC